MEIDISWKWYKIWNLKTLAESIGEISFTMILAFKKNNMTVNEQEIESKINNEFTSNSTFSSQKNQSRTKGNLWSSKKHFQHTYLLSN